MYAGIGSLSPPAHWRSSPPSHPRDRRPARLCGCRAPRGSRQARHLPQHAPQLRHSRPRARSRHPHHPGTARSPRRQHDPTPRKRKWSVGDIAAGVITFFVLGFLLMPLASRWVMQSLDRDPLTETMDRNDSCAHRIIDAWPMLSRVPESVAVLRSTVKSTSACRDAWGKDLVLQPTSQGRFRDVLGSWRGALFPDSN